ncbi:hypothetical protein KKA03_00295 [archaeon]|nr:hypothetical protein [archaeon]
MKETGSLRERRYLFPPSGNGSSDAVWGRWPGVSSRHLLNLFGQIAAVERALEGENAGTVVRGSV